MAAYRRVYDSRHLQADCQEPGSALTLRSAIEYGLPFLLGLALDCWLISSSKTGGIWKQKCYLWCWKQLRLHGGPKIAHFQRTISLEPFKFNNETDFTKMLHILCKLAQFCYRPIEKWQLSTVLVENISCYNLVKYQTNFIVFDCCYHKWFVNKSV